MIPVTKSFIPAMAEYSAILQRAFDKGWLTNRGELVLELEGKLKNYLEVEHLLVMTNGTLPIQMALKLLGESGEVITTPFSYVATVSSIVWEQHTPVFVDIENEHWTLDPAKIEEAITPKTKAILATHVFGNPCDVHAIEAIARKYQLKVIYDAAHSFGVEYHGKSLFTFGDISTCSFHATKVFHTGEGGAVFCNDAALYEQLYYSHNFGHNGPLAFHGLGVNAKISELQAAMGLSILPHMDHIFACRKQLTDAYFRAFEHRDVQVISIRPETIWNHSYFPVVFDSEERLLRVERALNAASILPRRYFYPSLNTLPYVDTAEMPIAESISKQILCLPLYVGLEEQEQEKICEIILAEL